MQGGTKDFEVLVSQDGKEWERAHSGWLRPGAPKTSTQYMTFTGKWARYVRCVRLWGHAVPSVSHVCHYVTCAHTRVVLNCLNNLLAVSCILAAMPRPLNQSREPSHIDTARNLDEHKGACPESRQTDIHNCDVHLSDAYCFECIRFVSKSGFKGGKGLELARIYSPVGINTVLSNSQQHCYPLLLLLHLMK
jgi:hypothetical protein